MPRHCTICTHPQRDAIDRALVEQERDTAICALWSVSRHALSRHRGRHLPATLVRAHRVAEVMHADELLDRLEHVAHETLSILHESRHGSQRDNALALRAVGRAERQIAMQVRLLAELREAAPDHDAAPDNKESPEGLNQFLPWWRVAHALGKAGRAHPEASEFLQDIVFELRMYMARVDAGLEDE